MRRDFSLVSTLILLFSNSSATFGQAQRAREMDSAPKATTLAGDEVVIPMIRQYHHARVDAFVNGQGPYRFVIDTGAPGLTISRALADALNLESPPDVPPGVEVGVRVSSGSGEGVPAKLVWADTLKVGGAEFSGVRTVALELPGKDHDGIIGMNIFRDVLLTFDYPANKVVLRNGELPAVNGKDILAYTHARPTGSHPSIEVDVCGQKVPFTLDSGMSGWFRVNSEIAQRCGFAAGPVAGPSARTVDRTIPTQAGRMSGDFTLGNLSFEQPVVMIDPNASPLIGGAALSQFVVTLDQKQKRIQFTTKSDGAVKCPPMRVLGLGLRDSDGGMEVWEIMPGSPAAGLGIQVGEKVTQINGRPAIDVYASEQWKEIVKSDTVELTLRRGSKDERIQVPVWELVP